MTKSGRNAIRSWVKSSIQKANRFAPHFERTFQVNEKEGLEWEYIIQEESKLRPTSPTEVATAIKGK